MKRKSGPPTHARRNAPAPVDEPVDESGDESADESGDGQERIVSRPDGFHWLARDGRQEFGPFETYEAALADMQAADEQSVEPETTLREAEDEIGITDWIDPETGEPPEGQSPPHLQEE